MTTRPVGTASARFWPLLVVLILLAGAALARAVESTPTFGRVATAPPGSEGAATASDITGLSLVEVPATGTGTGDALAVVLTGDGGWATLDKHVAAGLAAAGIPVVGWSSLTYYWTPRTPEQAAADLARIITHYTTDWRKTRVLVVGYSFGADVAPFLVNRLPEATRARVASVSLLEPSTTASFAFRLANWFGGGGDSRYPIAPEIARLMAPVTCVYGGDSDGSVCQTLARTRTRVRAVGKGHHFSGEYAALVAAILQGTGLPRPTAER